MKRSGILMSGLTAALALAIAPAAFALHSSEHYTLFGDAEYITPGNASDRAINLTSDADPGFGGIEYGVEDGITFADIEELSTDYRFETDDSCAGGSPRFQISVDTDGDGDHDGNIFVYIGPAPNYTGCAPDVWTNTGDLLETGNTVDTSQLGGAFYDPYDNAVANYGDADVLEISLVTDASFAFADSEQSVDIDNTTVDETLFTYEIPTVTTKDQCKNGGWQNFVDDEGNSFKNQGDCVSFVATQGKNQGAGN
jgi:hypothetical protein